MLSLRKYKQEIRQNLTRAIVAIQQLKNPEDLFLFSKLALNIPYNLGYIPVYFCTRCKNVHLRRRLRWRITVYSLILVRFFIFVFGILNATKFPLFHITNLFRMFRWSLIYFTGIIQIHHLHKPLSFASSFRTISTILCKINEILPEFRVSIVAGWSLILCCMTVLICGIFLPILSLVECKIHFLDDIFGICERGGALNTSYYKIILETLVHIVLTFEMVSSAFICFILVFEAIAFILAYFCASIIKDGNGKNEMDYFLNVKWFSVYTMIQLGFDIHNYYFGSIIFPATFNFLITTSVITISILIMYYKYLHVLIIISGFFYLFCVLFALVLELSLIPRFPSASYSAIQARTCLLAKHRSLDKYHKCLIKSLKPVGLRLGPFHKADFTILPITIEAIPTYTISLVLTAR